MISCEDCSMRSLQLDSEYRCSTNYSEEKEIFQILLFDGGGGGERTWSTKAVI